MRLSSRDFKIISLSLLLNSALLIAVALLMAVIISGDDGKGISDSAQDTESIITRDLVAEESRVVTAVEKANKAVVAVVVSRDFGDAPKRPAGDPFSNFFFPFDPFFGMDLPEGIQEIGGGSGFFVTEDGHIVTNRHVVDETDAIYTVVTNDGETYEAELLATDVVLDVAILKVEAEKPLPHLSFADSENLKLGQTTIAIGNALAKFPNSVSTGVVSGLSRSLTAGSRFGASELLDNVIQTDAAINPGNSGGPLLNLSGQVIGVNVAVASGSENIGFALPASEVSSIVSSVVETGRIVRPFIGVRYALVSAGEDEDRFEHAILVIPGARGESAVLPDSPAAKAGIQAGDLIVTTEGEAVTDETSLASIIRRKQIGDTITFEIVREEEKIEVLVTLAEAPENI